MNKNNSVIVINGRHYDAVTGIPHGGHKPSAAHTRHEAVPAPKPASRTVHQTAYRPTRHIARHKPEPAHTLMRQAVRKPASSVKRRIKVQGHLGFEGGREHSKIISHRPAKPSHARDTRHHAVRGNRGGLISHFSPHLFTAVDYVSVTVNPPAPARYARPESAAASRAVPLTTDELFEYAVHNAPAGHPQPHKRQRRLLKRRVHA